MRVGIGLGITRRQGGDPIAALFRPAGRTGWRYPLTLDTLFQDAAGTTPVTAPGQPVGLVLDTSRGLALGPESVTGVWSGNGNAQDGVTFSGDDLEYWATEFSTVVGRTYRFTGTLSGKTGNCQLRFRAGSAGQGAALYSSNNDTASVTVNRYIVATSTTSNIEILFRAAGVTATIDNISIRELPGNHKAQSTALNRPTYQVDDDGLPYLAYNGSNSSMATASFAWGSDKATICVGVRKLSDAASAAFLEFSPAIPSNAGAFALFAPGVSATASYLWRSRGSATQVDVSYTNAAVAAPVTNVLTGLGDISGDSAILRVNGTQVAQSTTDQGTGNYGTYQLFWGARAGTSLFFNGREYPSIGINAALTASELAMVEAWVTQRTGALG